MVSNAPFICFATFFCKMFYFSGGVPGTPPRKVFDKEKDKIYTWIRFSYSLFQLIIMAKNIHSSSDDEEISVDLDHFIAIYIIDNSLLLCFSSLVFSVLYSLLRKRRTNLKCQTVDGWHTSNKRKWSFVYNKCVNNMYRTFTMMK